MAGFSSIPVVGNLIGGFAGGLGAAEANQDARGIRQDLKHEIDDIKLLRDPILNQLLPELEQGGFMRSALGVPGISKALQEGSQYTQAAGDRAYRYGGSQYGGSGQFLASAARAPAKAVQAGATGDLQAADLLSRIDAAIRGAGNAFPPSQPQNQLASYGEAIRQFSQEFGEDTY